MFIVGVLLLVAAVAGAVILVGQNHQLVVTVHAAGHTWHWHLYWLLLAGLGITMIAWLGAALIRTGIASARRARREMAKLRLEHDRPHGRMLPDPDTSPFLADTGLTPIPQPGRRSRPRRGHHTV